ncbi:MAG: hypothetical protein ACI9WU_000681 [Myxococcota bacterium]|jgi:uncharacterized protein YqeY
MSETIEQQFTSRLKDAMRAKDTRVLTTIRAIRAKVGEARTAKGFTGEVDDALHLKIIAAYVKSMSKAKLEYDKAGARGDALGAALAFEIEYLSEFLPKRLDEAATIPLVEAAIASTGATSKKEIGKVMGAVMKSHRDQIEPGIVRAVADRLLP